jgi:NAD(P)-dependent dehydrogenase (short-subunit alcohol dehydrogenase family)
MRPPLLWLERVMAAWSADRIPDLAGKLVVITGASSGIGYEAALALAAKGAEVMLAVRDTARGEACAAKIRLAHRDAKLLVSALDLADLASVRGFAERVQDTAPRIDILLNNAGLGLQATRAVTKDGFERQFGTNHLGHFALTGLLVPALLRAPAPRVVTIASIAHKRGAIALDDLQTERPYNGRRAYGQSKLANLMFALELDRRARAQQSRLISVAAHPGVATTGFMAATEGPKLFTSLAQAAIGVFGQDAVHGALPGLYAATMPDVQGGQYWGPDGFMEIRGMPVLVKPAPQAEDRAMWAKLWEASEKLTGVTFPGLAN